MTTQQQVKDLQKQYGITEAEAVWVANNTGDELSEEDAVAAVEAMRTGPYVDRASYFTTVAAEPADDDEREPEPFPWDDEKIAGANAADLVDYVKEHPEEAERVAVIEGDHDGGPRKTVLDAVASVLEPADDDEEG